jgi:folate-dependent phosphoribosylglycinamide formyltransferase PurN
MDNMRSDTFRVVVVVADRVCGALKLAEAKGIPTLIMKDSTQASSYLGIFRKFQLDAVVFAGYLRIMPPDACLALNGRVINSHPALLPKFGGTGYFGLRVHEAVLKSGDTTSGCTVHLVSPIVDEGQIVAQRSLKLRSGETSWELAVRIHELEKQLLLEVLETWPRSN